MTAGLLAPRPPFCRAQNLVGWPALPLRAAWLGGTVVFGASTVLLMKRVVQPPRPLRSCWVIPPLRSLYSPFSRSSPSALSQQLPNCAYPHPASPLRPFLTIHPPPLPPSSEHPTFWLGLHTVCTHACCSSPLLLAACRRASLQSSAPLPAEPFLLSQPEPGQK